MPPGIGVRISVRAGPLNANIAPTAASSDADVPVAQASCSWFIMEVKLRSNCSSSVQT